MDTYGNAAYKMRAHETLREIEMIRALGVEIRNGIAVGRDMSIADLERDYDAIFIGVGLGETEDLRIPGENLEGCRDALSFIEETKSMRFDQVRVARRVAVIGGGNTAIDVVTAARRLGAEEVYIVYRRSSEEMSAFDYEYELAKQDSVTFVWQALPVRLVDDGRGRVAALECVRTRRGAKDSSGRSSFAAGPGSELRVEVAMVVKALGQKRKAELLRQIPNLKLKDGCVVVNRETMQTSNPRYFAGGECGNGGGAGVHVRGP